MILLTSIANRASIILLLLSSFAIAETINNPIAEQRADPWVYKHSDGYYYFTGSVPDYDRVILRRATTINGLTTAKEITAWQQPSMGAMSGFIWAPEIHYINDKWYIYYAASEKEDKWDIRIYVLENTSANPTTGTWLEKGELTVNGQGRTDRFFALDATTFIHKKQRYLIWAQIPPRKDSSLFIAKMITPWQIDQSTTTLISAPTFAWEKKGHKVNEGAAVIKRNGKIFVTYSASATDENYAIGLLTIDENANLLDTRSWQKNPVPIFKSSVKNSQYGPGHSSFTTSEDGSQDIVIYHARDYQKIIGEPLFDANRHTQGKVFTWHDDGSPNFGIPTARTVSRKDLSQ
ncbi:MAG: family 43 glycosylhydrolase [Colwellia sp.]